MMSFSWKMVLFCSNCFKSGEYAGCMQSDCKVAARTDGWRIGRTGEYCRDCAGKKESK